MEDALNGKPVDVFITQNGEEIPIKPKFKDIKDTVFQLAAHGFGMPTQALDVTGNMSFNLPEAILKNRKNRGLEPWLMKKLSKN